ncbi:primosomal protein N' family DNA-binding protein [Microbacterium halophytorum]|uniref:primosomal protein N' family DNA-binding protein n=1 Tax=Microbacterium halophytorum TaxID=2067568 RepID=UPI0015748414|nr:primosomal protein N' [Microbacterium halophytorum]
MGAAPRPIARILIDSPVPQLDRLFDYAIPPELVPEAVPGVRVKAPLRTAGRVVDGFVVELATEDDADRALSELDAVVSPVRALPERLHRLARAVADRSAGSASDVLRLAIPKRMVRAEKAWLAARVGAPAAEAGAEAESDTGGSGADAGAVVGDAAPEAVAGAATGELAGYPGLADRIAAGERLAVDAPPRPDAWARLLAEAAADTLARGRSAILAVPDHRDLDRLQGEVAALVPPDSLVRHDAGQTGPERYAGYLRTLEERACVVIGNRSSVYAPVHAPGLVAIWDDGDALYDEPLAPYAHARDVALVRQGLEPCALVFAGHTRSSDVQRLVEIGYVSESLAARRETANVQLSGSREDEVSVRVPSAAFRAAKDALAAGAPVLVQVARPGFAPTLVCADCRHPARCGPCGGPLHARSRGAVPVCGWCGVSAHEWACQKCRSVRFRLSSSGSERTADELGRAFAGTRVIVADGAHPVLEVAAEPALVVATRGAEPFAVGGYGAVLLLDGERMLQSPDLRIGEACLRWWSNAAALAAPGAPVHLAGVNGPVARAFASWTHAIYARHELAERAPLHLPPAARVARLEGEGGAVVRALEKLREAVPELAPDAVLGPVSLEAVDRFGPTAQRALIRFDYARGGAVAQALRAAVIAEVVGTRRRKDRKRANRATLAVRMDVLDPEL